ncbi:unnamed protein product, partial [Adineta ricciae]
NCDIAELLMKSAERIGIRLDRYVNREGCSAAVLALKYGHIECANQITHRDSDEFFVVPRPLSIYENPSTIIETGYVPTTISKKNKFLSNKVNHLSATMPFSLLKIIFNDSDSSYSTRLANLCQQDKHIRHSKQEAPQLSTPINGHDQTKSTTVNGARYISTQVLVNDSHILSRTKKSQISYDDNENFHPSGRISPRIQLLSQQRSNNSSVFKDQNSSFIHKTSSKTQISIDDLSISKSNGLKTENETNQSKSSASQTYQQTSSSRILRPKTTVHISLPPSGLSSAKIKQKQALSAPTKQKVLPNDRFDSASTTTKQTHSTETYLQPACPTRSTSAVTHRSSSKSNDLLCQIREATGPTSRYNKPEELFGLRPEELFRCEQTEPKIFDQQSMSTKTDESMRSKRSHFLKQHYVWQQDVDKLIELYNVHHSSTYRKSAIPPLSSLQMVTTAEPTAEAPSGIKSRQLSVSKHSTTSTASTSKSINHSKHSTPAAVSTSRRNSVHRHPLKLTHA